MLLHVMRHGPAEDWAASGRDNDRALTEQGRGRVARVATELRHMRRPALRVLASPVRRARETAEVAAAVLGAKIELRDELGLDADPPLPLAAALAKLDPDVLLVGHQPNVEHLVRTLAGPIPLPGGFCTAMIVTLEATNADPVLWNVRVVIDPRRLPSDPSR